MAMEVMKKSMHFKFSQGSKSREPVKSGTYVSNFLMLHTYVPESNEYVKGMANPSLLDVSSMGIARVPLNVKDQPESSG